MTLAQWQMFVIARVFDVMDLTTCYKNDLIAIIAVARHYQRELLKLLPIGHLPAQSH